MSVEEAMSGVLRFDSGLDFVCAYLVLTDNGITSVDDAERELWSAYEDIGCVLWMKADRMNGILPDSLADLYPLLQRVYAPNHRGDVVVVVNGTYDLLEVYCDPSVAAYAIQLDGYVPSEHGLTREDVLNLFARSVSSE